MVRNLFVCDGCHNQLSARFERVTSGSESIAQPFVHGLTVRVCPLHVGDPGVRVVVRPVSDRNCTVRSCGGEFDVQVLDGAAAAVHRSRPSQTLSAPVPAMVA